MMRQNNLHPQRRLRTQASVLAALAGTSVLGAGVPATAAHAAIPPITTIAPAAVPGPPAGKLSAGGPGCTSVGTAVSCDLYAMTGTTSFLGVTTPIWGFSRTGVAGSATAPGPLIVVHQGDQLSLNLHNQVPGESVSLALPGQPASSLVGTPGDDTTGVATGASKVYTFTAGRPGTFVYEAGHTADGSRQVAMGLAGALVVLPADGSAYGATAGYPATTYDDDAVLVLSEIDPRLNAAPATFDMRDFRPAYRLINGKPFPETDPISTGQGRTVLLRYANVGSQTHAMSVLGGNQVEVGIGGHQLKFTGTVAAESIEPGQTLDATVLMPTGPEAKLAVYEAAQHLDNNGQHTADPLQTAFGGMMTFLDTAAPLPSTDVVGPVSTHLSASPNPSDGLAPVTVSADVSDVTTGGSNVDQAELVIDDSTATGPGFATPMSGSFGASTVLGVTGTISTAMLAALDAGKHIVYVRGHDAAGNWGVVGSVVLNLPKTGPQTTNGTLVDIPANGASDVDISATGDDSAAGGTITAAEYFVDNNAAANGSGTVLTRNRTATVVSEDGVLPAATVLALGEGLHHVYVHSKDSLGLWGPLLDIELPVDLTGPGVDAASVGPNPSNGLLSDKSNPGYLLVSAQLTDRDAGGAVQSALVGAEAFLDPKVANPVGGTGLQLMAVDGVINGTTEAVYGLIPLSQVKALTDGTHHVYVRGKDAAGNWGSLFAVNLLVDKTAPVLGALVATPNPTAGAPALNLSAPLTELNTLQAAEFWFGTVDPGVGHASSVPVSVVGGNVVVTAPVPAALSGVQQINLRAQDLAGNWSKATFTTVTVQKPNAIFSDTFDSGNLNTWSARTGGVTSTSASRLVTPSDPGTLRGMQAIVPTTGTNRLAYVTDNSPAADTSYKARFAFNRNTLISGAATTVLTLFEGRTATNASVFAVQYRYTAGVSQVRTLLFRSGGAATVTGAWVNLAAGTQILRVDWLAGPATGANAGSLKLTVNNAVVQTLTGNTSTLSVDSVRLGVTAGATTTSGSSGTAFFDWFSSTRYTLP
jgi:FtsP/CotA-like multicopper oxidase with cupredoxin domain